MRLKLFSLFFFLALFVFLPLPSKANIPKLSQQIEIIKQEISLLQNLLLNSQLKQEITAHTYLAIKLADNSVLLEKNSSQSFPLASVTKLMSAVITLENIALNEQITLTEKMLEPLGYSPCLFLGQKISAENLLKASLIQSTNDAAESLAYFLGKERFIKLMNEKAKEINLTKTVFYDTHGLNPANRSTAQDLVKLLIYIHQNHQEILSLTKNNNFWLPDATGHLLKFQNVNNFYPFSNFIGGKTGYLPEAKQTLAAMFKVKGEKIAIVLLSSSNRQADTFNLLEKLTNKL